MEEQVRPDEYIFHMSSMMSIVKAMSLGLTKQEAIQIYGECWDKTLEKGVDRVHSYVHDKIKQDLQDML